ncbi:DUF3027 domain-containing protein [Frigoribacterium sp. UYMn621]|uniref:DUF3027 domain-containing protein n=1 Tax=Frigoribacterium sp. UYMn621 TaxID=3156343 RepID=UPI003393CD8F
MPASVALDSDFDLGRTALLEITSAESIGDPAGSIDSGEGVTTVYFETLLSGYPGWRWTVSIAHLEDTPASVLETELTPGDDALLSPAWVPWVDRLADYTAAQDTAVEDDESNDELDDDDDDDESDESDDDESDDEDSEDDESDDDDDDDDLGSDVLHGGDLDGVDIDDLDETDDDTDTDLDETDDDEADDESDDDDPDLDDLDDPEDEHERSV